MPQSLRHTRSILRTVNGRKHASDNDREEVDGGYSTLPPSGPARRGASVVIEEDIYADPVSSEDESLKQPRLVPPAPARTAPINTRTLKRIKFDGFGGQSIPALKPQFSLPSSISRPRSADSKHEGDDLGQPSSESDGDIFSSQGLSKRPHTAQVNIHVQSQPQQRSSKKSSGYGRKADRQRIRDEEKVKRRPLQRPEKGGGKVLKDVKPEFRIPTTSTSRSGMFGFKGIDSQEFPGPPERLERELSSPLSVSDVPPSPDADEIAQLDLPVVGPHVLQVECSICGAQVSRLVKENFEDNFNHSKQVNYRWQQRFCRFHRQESAREMWGNRGYPHINWETFADRIKKRNHTQHVQRVMSGEVDSLYRMQLVESVKGRNKTLIQAMKNDDGAKKKVGSVGYYGPRGEKLMYVADSVVNAAAKTLQDRAYSFYFRRNSPRPCNQRPSFDSLWCLRGGIGLCPIGACARIGTVTH